MTVDYAFNGAGNMVPTNSQEGMIDFGDGLGRVRAYRSPDSGEYRQRVGSA